MASGFLFRNYLSDLEKYPNTQHGICTGDLIFANILRTDDLVLMVDLLNDLSVYFSPNFPGDWRSRSVTVCFSCARNFVLQHKINFCVDVERMMRFLCVWLYFICVSPEFVLGSCAFPLSLRCYRAHGEPKMVSNQHIINTKISWSHASKKLLGYWARTQ